MICERCDRAVPANHPEGACPTDETTRQAVLALLGRLPSSEWGNFWLLGKTLYGEERYGKREYISRLGDELAKMKFDGLIERRGHLGWRLKAAQ